MAKKVSKKRSNFVAQTEKPMAQELGNIQGQEQSLGQEQKLTAAQVAFMRMLEMPVDDLRERIEKELEENVALEKDDSGADDTESPESLESQERKEAADGPEPQENLMDQGTIDEIEYFESERPGGGGRGGDDDAYTIDDPDLPQFRDTLMQQVGEYALTDHQRELLEYLIGSLDDDGLLTKKLYVLADELEVYMGIETTVDELREVLLVLQQFDPPGIGAQSLQETLVLQIRRRIEEHPDSVKWRQLLEIVEKRWEQLTLNHWNVIRERQHISEGEMRALQRMLRTLTPRPGCAPGETMAPRGASTNITADFVVEVGEDGTISVSLNERGVPTLRVSPEYEALARRSLTQMPGRTGAERRRARDYTQGCVMRATSFLYNLRSRSETMLRIMREVVAAQREFFLTGDDGAIRQFMMKDVGETLGLDISIVSRAVKDKWVDTPYGMRPMRFFFRGMGGVKREDGTQLGQDSIMQALADLIAAEDKRAPLSDERLTKILQSKGFPVARRTVAKYREKLQIPVARMRTQH